VDTRDSTAISLNYYQKKTCREVQKSKTSLVYSFGFVKVINQKVIEMVVKCVNSYLNC
jgi:hypothetical protein